MREATAYIDGSGNSGRIQACAVVLYVDDECHKRSRLLAPHTTNNVGEYSGLLLAISLAAELGIEELHILSDSKLIVYQVRGKWKCKDRVLRNLRDLARTEALVFRKVSISWIPREQNQEADSLCRKAIKISQLSPDNPFLQVRA